MQGMENYKHHSMSIASKYTGTMCKEGSAGDILGAVSALCGVPLRAIGPCPLAALMQLTQGIHCGINIQPAVAPWFVFCSKVVLGLHIADTTE